jgi:hypothetical protein
MDCFKIYVFSKEKYWSSSRKKIGLRVGFGNIGDAITSMFGSEARSDSRIESDPTQKPTLIIVLGLSRHHDDDLWNQRYNTVNFAVPTHRIRVIDCEPLETVPRMNSPIVRVTDRPTGSCEAPPDCNSNGSSMNSITWL